MVGQGGEDIQAHVDVYVGGVVCKGEKVCAFVQIPHGLSGVSTACNRTAPMAEGVGQAERG